MSIRPPRQFIHPMAHTQHILPRALRVFYRPTPTVLICDKGMSRGQAGLFGWPPGRANETARMSRERCFDVAWNAARNTSLNPIAGTRVPQHQQLGLSADCCQARYDELVTIVQYEAMGDNVPAAHERRALVNPELECKVALD